MPQFIRETPMQNPILGLLADRLKKAQEFGAKPFGYENPPVEMLMNLLGVPAVQQTMERMAYGEPLTTGRGMTTKPRPEAVEAAMAVAPVAGLLAKTTKGLPVGASIEDVSKAASKSIVREGNPIQGAVFLIGDKIFIGRTHGEALNRAVYEGAVRKEGSKYIYPKNVEINNDLFITKDGQIIDRLQASKLLDVGASETAIEKGLMQNNPSRSMSVDSYIEEAKKLKKLKESYPQQEALDKAQRNAALPIEEGGLGLPKDNTPEMRAEAMGYKTPAYRGSTAIEKSHTNPIWWTEDPSYANTYAAHMVKPPIGQPDPYAGNVMPLLVKIGNEKQFEKFSDGGVPLDPFSGFSNDIQTGLRRYPKNNLTGELGGKVWEAVSVPENVRSRFAAFDPKRRNEADILAGVLPLGLLADEEQRKKLYELMPSLLGQ